MKIATASLESLSPYSQSKHISEERPTKETAKDFEARTWRQRIHADERGSVFIPPMAFKNCIAEAAKFLALQIPGKGKATYTKHFEAGILVIDPVVLPMKKDDVPGEWLFLPSDGKRGSGSRVDKCYPVIQSWRGDVRFHILDDVISEEVFERVLDESGKFIGIGRFRPRNNGFYGRFKVASVEWSEE